MKKECKHSIIKITMCTRKNKRFKKRDGNFCGLFIEKAEVFRIVFFAWKYEILEFDHCTDSLHLYEYITFYLLFIKISNNYSAKKLREYSCEENSGKY